MSYVSERIPNAFRTVNSAEFRANNAYNGFDFASSLQPAVKTVADQPLAREKLLPKCHPEPTPTAVMAGPGLVIWCARKRNRFRAPERLHSGGRASGTQLSLSRAGARPPGDRPRPGHDNDRSLLPRGPAKAH
jgi:hypothetical protein